MDGGTSPGDHPLFRVRLWGTLRVEKWMGGCYEAVKTTDWGGSNYPRMLLKALLCCSERSARREALLEMLWPETGWEQATAYLNTATTKLRTVLRPAKGQESLLITEDDSSIYQLPDQRVLWVDCDAVQDAIERAEQIGRTSLEALSFLEEAFKLSGRGTFLEGEEEQWAAKKRATREIERYRARLWLAENYEMHHTPGHAETILKMLLEEDPFDEDVLCRLMRLLHGQGMTHQALLLYKRMSDFFAQERMKLTEATRALAILIREKHSLLFREDVLIASEIESDNPTNEGRTIEGARSQQFLALFPSPQKQERLPSLSVDPSFLEALDHEESRSFLLQFQQDLVRGVSATEQQQEYPLSRRQALFTIAALTMPLVAPFQKRLSSSAIEVFLSSCSASIAACWEFSREFDIGPMYSFLSHYLPPLISLMQESRSYQKRAAHLAAQTALLRAIIGRHVMDLHVAEISCKQAVVYSQIAEDPLLHVITLRHLAMIYFYGKRHAEERALYEQMKPFLKLKQVPPIVQSFIYAGLAGIQAQDQQKDVFTSLSFARDTFLQQPATDPGPLYVDYDYSQVFLSEGLAYYDLGRYQEALDTFLQVNQPSLQISLAERGRLEFLNWQARSALCLPNRDRDMQQCIAYWTAAIQGAVQLKSKQRYHEVAHTYELMLCVWPHESKIKALRGMFTL